MKRKPSHEQFLQEALSKETAKKTRSPINPKKRPKFENEVLSFLGTQKGKTAKLKQETQKVEVKAESQNSTANCTFSRSRLPKPKKAKQKEDKGKNESLTEKEIMKLINSFATKIQRQWKVHLMRKRFSQLISTIRKGRKSQQRKYVVPSVPSFDNLKFDENKIKHLSYLTENGEEIVSSYNLQKYVQYQPNQQHNAANNEPLSYRSHANSDNSIKFQKEDEKKKVPATKKSQQDSNSQGHSSRAKESSKERNQSASNFQIPSKIQTILQKQQRRVSYDSCQLQKRSNIENRRHSTGDLLSGTQQLKSLQIGKAFEIKIEQEKRISPRASIKKVAESSPAKRGQDQREGFNIKYPFDRQLKNRRKAIEDHKCKKLLSIEGRFKRKEVTQRSYLELVYKINEQHDNRLQTFKQRQGEIRSNWCKLLAISKENKFAHKYLEDQHHNSISNIDASVSFDRWDFNSSAKKSIDGNLDIELHTSKNYSLESVLRYLQDEETEKQEEKKFKKQKSKQIIEAIAERSKEISDKDVQEFHEEESQEEIAKGKIQENYLQIEPDVVPLPTEKIVIQEPPQETIPLSQQKAQKEAEQNHSINLQSQECFQSAIKKKAQAKSESQSLLISQIQAVSPSDNIFSQKQLPQPQSLMKDLLFKDFHSQQKQQPPSQSLVKFLQLVNEKLVLSNIKLINSIKFMFAKMGQERRLQKAKTAIKYPAVESDINAINTWLLQISHFILDNYQNVIRDNLTIIKQPPGLELLGLAHKNIAFSTPYETVPEYVFKDFEFYYIKTLARNYGITPDQYDAFSTLLYTFHRSLIDSLNLALTEELLTGRRWLQLPWLTEFKQKKRIINEHAKVCLQRSINVVSNWGEYGLGRMHYEDQVAELQSKQYQEEKINLVCREESLDLPLVPLFTEANMLLQIANTIFNEELTLACRQIS